MYRRYPGCFDSSLGTDLVSNMPVGAASTAQASNVSPHVAHQGIYANLATDRTVRESLTGYARCLQNMHPNVTGLAFLLILDLVSPFMVEIVIPLRLVKNRQRNCTSGSLVETVHFNPKTIQLSFPTALEKIIFSCG